MRILQLFLRTAATVGISVADSVTNVDNDGTVDDDGDDSTTYFSRQNAEVGTMTMYFSTFVVGNIHLNSLSCSLLIISFVRSSFCLAVFPPPLPNKTRQSNTYLASPRKATEIFLVSS